LVGILATVVVMVVVFYDSLAILGLTWLGDENYGHGLFVPPIALYLAWEKRKQLRACEGYGTWFGFLIIAAGMGLFIVGQLATLFVVQHLALWVVIVGLVVAGWGLGGGGILAFPLGLLLMTIPLPQFLFQGLSGHLRSISSTLGVTCLQVVGITAFQDGNVIDLGPIQLQVVEACSGLRFLFPLMTLALLCAYFLHDRFWKRVVLFLSSIPIAIVLNGFRIGMIGLLVEWFGKGAADGFIHLFEGWVIFLVGVALLVGEMALLKRLWPLDASTQRPDPQRGGVGNADGGCHPMVAGRPLHSDSMAGRVSWPLVSGLVIVGYLGLLATHLEARADLVIPRQSFVDFPLHLSQWEGTARPLEQVYIDALRFDDYLLADFRLPEDSNPPINLYVAYYQSQRSGESIHSPQSCIPGGGWLITSLNTIPLEGPSSSTEPLFVNELMIKKGEAEQVVWYWFQQRQRNLTNEYLVKWYLLWDTVTQRRTDGALIRFTTSIPSQGDHSVAKARLAEFAQLVHARLDSYVPR
ncbi:MAG: VPLPA-CTERM-specific exosortase XrtD, partial [Nitrospirota bacterium]